MMLCNTLLPSAILAASTLLHLITALPQGPQIPTGEKILPDGGYGLGYTIYGTDAHLDRCDPTNSLNASLEDVNLMVKAGLEAVGHLDQPPFNYFFIPQAAEFIQHALTNLHRFTESPQDHIGWVDIDCNNPVLCNHGSDGNSTQLGATKRLEYIPGHTAWVVSICPTAFARLKKSPPPCTTSPGVPSLGWVMAKQLAQMSNIVEEIYDKIQGPVNIHKSVTERNATTLENAESYAYFLQWSYDLGYGLRDGKQCLDHWVEHPQDVLPAWQKAELESGK
ncbi:MAG: hypothetical protein Q9213_007793 [Squamulea squamosa]